MQKGKKGKEKNKKWPVGLGEEDIIVKRQIRPTVEPQISLENSYL